jgi:glyoxylase-like metal-dependent hydrolase (beta-lactamase superfamily II)
MQQLTQNVRLFGNGYFNYYLAGDEEAALIECGTSAGAHIFAGQWEAFKDKPDVKYIVILHSHFDHVCGLPILKKLFPSALVVASSGARKILSKEKAMASAFNSDHAVSESYLKAGFIDRLPEIPESGPIAVDVVVGEGDRLLLGDNLKLDILDAPGHSACSVAVFLESDGVLLASDAAGYQSAPGEISPVFFQNYDFYMATLKRFQNLPLKVLGMAHGDIIQGEAVSQYLRQTTKAAEEAFAWIKEDLHAGVDEEQISQKVFKRYFKGGLSYYPADIMYSTMKLLVTNVKAKL